MREITIITLTIFLLLFGYIESKKPMEPIPYIRSIRDIFTDEELETLYEVAAWK